ncbi:uncharacterized protein L201_006374 [Kwoniella dendrophila CBS 6074]|uniref:Mitochondrial protein n=1 Tax=Kwoniella dendrophila CBS 6074 TaxID=1295534 RepID=A0AAX4K2V3_9TREE
MHPSTQLYKTAAAQIKLSPSLKSLVNSSGSLPTAIPAPSFSVTSKVFDGIRSNAPPYISRKTWLTIGTATLITVNSPETLCQLWDYAGKKVEDAGIMREVGLKCISFNGIPRTINGLGALRAHLPEDVKKALPTKAYRQPDESNISRITKQSRELWDSIYTPFENKLLNKLGDSHPDLPIHILNSHYGPLLSDPPNLEPEEYKIGRVLSSIIAITCLRTQRGVGPQLLSHVFGLKKAQLTLNPPSNKEGSNEIDKIAQEENWLCTDQGVTWILESADKLSQVVTNGEITFGGSPGLDSESE